MPLSSIPSTWTAPTSCFASTNYCQGFTEAASYFNRYGVPTAVTGDNPIGDCYPPSSTPGVPYLTDGPCPTGYTRACATGVLPDTDGQTSETVTCCPRFVVYIGFPPRVQRWKAYDRSVTGSDFSFECVGNKYGCHASAKRGVVWTGVGTWIVSATSQELVTRMPRSNEEIQAWGVKLFSVGSVGHSILLVRGGC